ncbi:hypothetical protein EYB25_000225 [Talaromyces marneffei]|nr:hypothetical protein EYB25_000225 [Talaromyces marneffei]
MVAPEAIKPWLRATPSSYLLINANVVDVRNGTILKNSSVTIKNGIIESITPNSTSAAPESSSSSSSQKVIDCKGKFLCPGLFDAHVHLMAVPGFTDLSKAFGNPNDVHVLRQPPAAMQITADRTITLNAVDWAPRDWGGSVTEKLNA